MPRIKLTPADGHLIPACVAYTQKIQSQFLGDSQFDSIFKTTCRLEIEVRIFCVKLKFNS